MYIQHTQMKQGCNKDKVQPCFYITKSVEILQAHVNCVTEQYYNDLELI